VPAAASVLATSDGVELRLEGWADEVEQQARAAKAVSAAAETLDESPFPSRRPWEGAPVIAEAAVPPSRLADVVGGPAWGALAGVGIAWIGLEDEQGALEDLRSRARAAGGIAPVIQGRGGLGDEPLPAPEVQRRLKRAFDPNGVLAPGRGWGERSPVIATR
jgi:hypothetical protein